MSSFVSSTPKTRVDFRGILKQLFELSYANDGLELQQHGKSVKLKASDGLIGVLASIMEEIMIDTMDKPIFQASQGERLVDKRELSALREVEAILRSKVNGAVVVDGNCRLSFVGEEMKKLTEELNLINSVREAGLSLAEQEEIAAVKLLNIIKEG